MKLAINLLFLALIGGWIANLVKLIGLIGGEVTTMFIVRIVGVFTGPVGSVLGFL